MVKKPTKHTMPTADAASSSSTAPLAPATFSDSLPLPKLIVFDLDYTLWPFWVDTHVTPPLKASPTHDSATDRFKETFQFYNDVPSILLAIREKGIQVGIASRTSAPALGKELLRLLHVPDADGTKNKALDYCDYLEIYPGSKITHFTKLQKSTGLKYEEMLFFDDESRNKNVETLGVVMHLVRDGVTRPEIDNGVRAWRAKHKLGS